MSNVPTRFSDLKIGERFNWADIRTASPRYNVQFGPFTKISRKRYEDRDKTMKIPVESASHYVARVAANPATMEAAS